MIFDKLKKKIQERIDALEATNLSRDLKDTSNIELVIVMRWIEELEKEPKSSNDSEYDERDFTCMDCGHVNLTWTKPTCPGRSEKEIREKLKLLQSYDDLGTYGPNMHELEWVLSSEKCEHGIGKCGYPDHCEFCRLSSEKKTAEHRGEEALARGDMESYVGAWLGSSRKKKSDGFPWCENCKSYHWKGVQCVSSAPEQRFESHRACCFLMKSMGACILQRGHLGSHKDSLGGKEKVVPPDEMPSIYPGGTSGVVFVYPENEEKSKEQTCEEFWEDKKYECACEGGYQAIPIADAYEGLSIAREAWKKESLKDRPSWVCGYCPGKFFDRWELIEHWKICKKKPELEVN